jgi:HEPN domain-containing protein
MKQRSDPEVAAWLEKAGRDLRMAQLAIEAESPMPDQACFHSQQCAEKVLKALLVAADLPVPRTHNLLHLAAQLRVSVPSLRVDDGSLAHLTSFGVSPRYPSWLAEETLEEAEEALCLARRIMEIAESLI